jgi:Glycosyltransferase family 87
LTESNASWFRLGSAAAAVALFLVSWALLHHGFYARNEIVDTPVYERYGEAMTQGQVPYRDFAVEYPPAALPVFLVPAIGDGDSDTYRRRFEGLMAGFGAMLVVCVALALAALGAGLGRLAAGVAFVAVAPLLLGSVVLSRFDLWPAMLVAGAVAALVSGRLRLGSGLLGLAVAAKLWPGVLVPLVVAYVWRTRGRREALVCGIVFAAVVVACFLPFLVLAPVDVLDSVWRQARRPLQIESLGSALLLAGHHAFGLDLTMKSSNGSQNLDGALPDTVAVVQGLVQAGVLIALWVSFARGPATRERLVRYAAAAVLAFIALGKVLSPQFLIWLVPLVPLVRGRRGLIASILLAVALVLTQLWFPYRYWDLALRFDATASWLVLARDSSLCWSSSSSRAGESPRSATAPDQPRPGFDPGHARNGHEPVDLSSARANLLDPVCSSLRS